MEAVLQSTVGQQWKSMFDQSVEDHITDMARTTSSTRRVALSNLDILDQAIRDSGEHKLLALGVREFI